MLELIFNSKNKNFFKDLEFRICELLVILIFFFLKDLQFEKLIFEVKKFFF